MDAGIGFVRGMDAGIGKYGCLDTGNGLGNSDGYDDEFLMDLSDGRRLYRYMGNHAQYRDPSH
jgi:hypothetical protein